VNEFKSRQDRLLKNIKRAVVTGTPITWFYPGSPDLKNIHLGHCGNHGFQWMQEGYFIDRHAVESLRELIEDLLKDHERAFTTHYFCNMIPFRMPSKIPGEDGK